MPERPPPASPPPGSAAAPTSPASSFETPPMSTTSLPANARARPSGPRAAVQPPILASDILREEVAPRAPARTMIRIWLGTFAAACALSAVAARLGFGPHTARVFEGSLVAGVIAAVGAIAPAPYTARATLAVLSGAALLGLGVADRGPLAPLGNDGSLHAAAGVALATVLPAALLFRARFRAFVAARVVLTIALVVALPAIVLGVLGALNVEAPVASRIADGLLSAAALTGLFGYMGAETTGGCGRWAALILGVFAARVAVGVLPLLLATPMAEAGESPWGYLVAGIGTLAATTIAAFGLFQILATALGNRARKVDVHQIAAKREPEGEPGEE